MIYTIRKLQIVCKSAESSGVKAQILLLGQIFRLQASNSIFLGYRFSKHKTTGCARNLIGAMTPLFSLATPMAESNLRVPYRRFSPSMSSNLRTVCANSLGLGCNHIILHFFLKFFDLTHSELKLLPSTHVSLAVEFVIGKFQLVEGDLLSHPNLSPRRWIGVKISARDCWSFRGARCHPLGTMVYVPMNKVLNSYPQNIKND